mgnify:CR=1 FL=1
MARFMNPSQLLGAAGLYMQMKKENETRPLDQQISEDTLRRVAAEKTKAASVKSSVAPDAAARAEAEKMFEELTGGEGGGLAMKPMERMKPMEPADPPPQPMEPDLPMSEEPPPPVGGVYARATDEDIMMGQAAMGGEPVKATIGSNIVEMSGPELAAKSEHLAAQRAFNSQQIGLQKDPKVKQAMIDSMNESGQMESEINAEIARRQASNNPAAVGAAIAEFDRSVYG